MPFRLLDSQATRLPPADILKRFAHAEKIKKQWEPLLRAVYEYFLPHRNLYYTDSNTQGAYKGTDRVFDSTAQQCITRGANRIQSTLMPPFAKWAGLKAGPLVPDRKRDEINAILQGVERKLFAVLHASNFDTSINETILELLVGTAALLTLPGDFEHPVMFAAIPLQQVYLEEGAWGSVGGVFRKHKMLIRNIKDQWDDIKNLPEELEKLQASKPDAEVEILEYTYPSNKAGGKKVWVYDLLIPSLPGKTDANLRLHFRVYNRNPWITPRWLKIAGEVYGRGPAIFALPDVKTQNKVVELILRNAALQVAGVYTYVDDGILNPNTIAIIPGAAIQVGANAGARGPSLQRLEGAGDIGLAFEINETLVAQIKRHMLDDSLPPESGAVRSATEIIQRIKDLARDIGSPFGRLYTELMVPLVQNTLDIMEDAGIIQAVSVNGLGVRVVVTSPLAIEQNVNEVENCVRWLSVLAQFGNEAVTLAAKVEEIGAWMGEKLGVPADLIRTKTERENMKKALANAAAKQLGAESGDNVVPMVNLPSGGGMGVDQLPMAA
jgi:hypothetical protein